MHTSHIQLMCFACPTFKMFFWLVLAKSYDILLPVSSFYSFRRVLWVLFRKDCAVPLLTVFASGISVATSGLLKKSLIFLISSQPMEFLDLLSASVSSGMQDTFKSRDLLIASVFDKADLFAHCWLIALFRDFLWITDFLSLFFFNVFRCSFTPWKIPFSSVLSRTTIPYSSRQSFAVGHFISFVNRCRWTCW